MHDRMRRALTTYRWATPAPIVAQLQADRFMGTAAWAQHKHNTFKCQSRIERQRVVVEGLRRDAARREHAFAKQRRLITQWKKGQL